MPTPPSNNKDKPANRKADPRSTGGETRSPRDRAFKGEEHLVELTAIARLLKLIDEALTAHHSGEKINLTLHLGYFPPKEYTRSDVVEMMMHLAARMTFENIALTDDSLCDVLLFVRGHLLRRYHVLVNTFH